MAIKMINKSVTAFILLLMIDNILFAQNSAGSSQNDTSIYIVMMIALLTWLALSFYIFVLNKKIKSLEKKLINDE